jgi:hypothetical protein
VILYDFLFLKNDVNVSLKSIKQKIEGKQLFFVEVLKVTDENSGIRIRIWIKISWIRNTDFNYSFVWCQAYLRENLLQQHMRSHQGLRPFVCNECGAQFTMKNNFKRHVEEHAGQRYRTRGECGSGSGSPKSMRIRIRLAKINADPDPYTSFRINYISVAGSSILQFISIS